MFFHGIQDQVASDHLFTPIQMKVYNVFSRFPLARNRYALKFLIVALPGMLVPLITLSLYITYSTEETSRLRFLGIAAVLLTIAAAVASYFLYVRLLKPIYLARKAINKYTAFRNVPSLPTHHEDEAGMLLHDIQHALEQIDEQLTEKSDMIDLLSHDLRSPVTRIMGLSNVIKLDDDPETVEYAEMISTECRNLLTMMENILLMFREDVLAFAPQNVNLLSLAEDSVKFFNILAGQKNLSLKVDIDEHLFINVQQGLFTQAMRNILGNAIKFSSEGKAIYISAKQVGHQVQITIRDEGVGMGQKELVQIFERFTAAGKKGTHGETSIGLGLYLCKKIIEKQGGHVAAYSEGANKGAVFTITLYQLITKKPKGDHPVQEVHMNGKAHKV